MILDLNLVLADLSQEDHLDESVKHALKVRSAWALSNHHRFFHLYLNAPKMAGYLMDKFVGRIRKAALKAIIKAYVSVMYLQWYQLIVECYLTSLILFVVFVEKMSLFQKKKLQCLHLLI